MIELTAKTRIWIAAGVTDMRRGFKGLSAQVQTVLNEQPYSEIERVLTLTLESRPLQPIGLRAPWPKLSILGEPFVSRDQ